MRALWRRPGARRALRIAVFVALAVLVFGVILPSVIDYDQVWTAVKRLTWWQVIVLAVLSLVRVATEALVYRSTLPGLRIRDGMLAFFNSTVAGTFLPPPADAAIRYSMFTSSGMDRQASAVTAIGSFIFPTAVRLIAPAVAFVPLVIVGRADGDSLVIAFVCLGVGVAVGGVALLIARSERAAHRVGEVGGRAASWVLVKLGKDALEEPGRKTVEFRSNAVEIVRHHWKQALLAVSLSVVAGYLILLVALRFLDVSDDTLSWAEILAAYTLALWINTVIPITAGGLGVIDATLIAVLSYGADDELRNTIVAAVLLWRVFFWALPLPIGAVTLSRWRKANPDMKLRPDRGDIRAEAEVLTHDSRR